MSNYTKSTNFATKDNLTPGDPLKVVRGTEIDTEFNNIATAVATKTDNSAAAITGGSITGITDLAVADGGTGASTAAGALNNLLPSQTSAANKYLQSDGTNASWDAVTLSTADITGTLPVANGGTGVTTSTGTGNVVLSNSPTLVTPALGTPSALVGTNITGTASGLTAGNVTTNANLTGAVTSVGNATSLGSFTSSQLAGALTDETGSGSAVFATSPTLVTPILGTPTSATLTNATGLPISTGVSGLGTGIATALAVNTGSAGAPVLFNGALGTPSSGTVTNLTGTASININGTVGATTATTGAFTTLTTSSTVTHNGGTANGVTYLNGSKVLTSGSALTFDGTNLGVGTASPATKLHVEVSGASSIITNKGTSANYYGYAGSTLVTQLLSSSTQTLLNSVANVPIIFSTNDTERMRLDASGNLGLGVTPSAWRSVFKAGQVGNGASLVGRNDGMTVYLSSNWYNNSASQDTYIGTGNATQYYQDSGSHVWRTSASGTAGNAITFTQAMTLDASGGLQIGRTSVIGTNNRLAIQMSGTSASGYTAATNASLAIDAGTSTNTVINMVGGGDMGIYRSNSSNAYDVGISLGSNADRIISFTTANAERARIDSSGNLLVGGTAQSGTANRTAVFSANKFGLSVIDTTAQAAGVGGALNLGGNYRSAGDAQAFARVSAVKQNSTDADFGYGMAFSVTPNGGTFTEAARIDSSGNLLVGTTTRRNNATLTISYSGTTNNGIAFIETSTSSGTEFLAFQNSSATNIGTVARVGTTNAVVYNTTSDYRLKTVTGAVTGQGSRIDALKPIDYLWTEGGQQARGFLAHEFQTVYPNSVTGDKDALDANGNPKYQAMQAATSEVIADLIAEIQSLRQRLSAANL